MRTFADSGVKEGPFFTVWEADTCRSRDRSCSYADGARRGAPQAIQVSDRIHLLVNLHTALTRLFGRKHDLLKRMAAEEHVSTDLVAAAPIGVVDLASVGT